MVASKALSLVARKVLRKADSKARVKVVNLATCSAERKAESLDVLMVVW